MTQISLKLLLSGGLLLISELANADAAINAVKQQTQVQTLLQTHLGREYEVAFDSMNMGGHCGFVGCQWRKMVSVVITANRANSPSMTILAEVTGFEPDHGQPPKVRFVEMTDMSSDSWTSTIMVQQPNHNNKDDE